MKKSLVISILMFMFINLIEAQSTIKGYLIGTTTADTTVHTGIVKWAFPPTKEIYPSSVINSPTVGYEWKSGTYEFILAFRYADYNLTELKKSRPIVPGDSLRVTYVPTVLFTTLIRPQAYNLDQIMATDPTGSNIATWAKPLLGKFVYFIEPQDITSVHVKMTPVQILWVNNRGE